VPEFGWVIVSGNDTMRQCAYEETHSVANHKLEVSVTQMYHFSRRVDVFLVMVL